MIKLSKIFEYKPISNNDLSIKIDICDNDNDRSKGLMFVKSMPEDKGMLFKFDLPKPLSFWNMNTYMDLDVLFIDKDYKIKNIEYLPSILYRPVTMVHSNGDCQFVLEVNSGFCDAHDIREGDFVYIDGGRIKFKKG